MQPANPMNEPAPELPMTAAPWSRNESTRDVATAPPPPRPGMTGRPVRALVQAEAGIPQPASKQASYQAPGTPIKSEADLQRFLQSQTLKSFVGFILALNEAVRGRKLSDACHVSPPVERMAGLLATLSAWVDETPPVERSLRYGNPAFRDWLGHVSTEAPRLVAELLPEGRRGAAVELAPYLAASFGNATRIDYGTGHEATFVALLYCLAALGVVGAEDLQALVTRVFAAYLDLMRKVQTTYWLEPAGSRGVWGLDDYQFLPFLWGSAQLAGHPSITPASIHAHRVLEEAAGEYLYLGCVAFVKRVKKGPLQETSPLLCDVSAVPHWEKVNSGMLKMYQAEVLAKLPMMQHFLCGSLLPFT